MRRIDRRIVIIAALVFLIGLSYGLMRFLIAQKEEPPIRAPKEVKRLVDSERVTYSTIISPVEAPGRVASVSEIDLVAEASGKIQTSNIILKKGSSFQKGDLLYTIYPDEAKLALLARKSQYRSSLANILPDLRFDFPEYEKEFRSFLSNIDINKDFPPLPDINDEKLRIFLAGKNILSEYYSIKKDDMQLKRHSITAPFSGTYSDVYLEEGAYTNTGGRIAHVIRTDLLEAEIPLNRFDALWVKKGDKVHVISDRYTEKLSGTVIRKAGFVDQATQSQSVFVRIPNNPEKPLLVGEYINVVFPGRPVENSMEIPRSGVFNTNEVFVVKEGRLQKKTINIIKINERTLLFNGLNEGEIVVTQALINVTEGTEVLLEGDSPDPKVRQKKGQGRRNSENVNE